MKLWSELVQWRRGQATGIQKAKNSNNLINNNKWLRFLGGEMGGERDTHSYQTLNSKAPKRLECVYED